MNYRMILQVVGRVLLIEALLLILPLAVALIYGEPLLPLIIPMLIAAVLGWLLRSIPVVKTDIGSTEGFTIVGLSWIVMSLVGAFPFVLSGAIPNYIDAVFETVSGFTTTGASIMTNVEILNKSCAFWRLFTHWVGGMGVLVFIMVVLPMSGDHYMYIMRAEVPGPVVGKLVPRARKTAEILYLLYIALTLLEVFFLLCGGMSFYDALVHSFATAGTGGFSIRAASIGYYNSTYIDIVIGTFMLLFSINFNLYYLLLIGESRQAVRSEELRVFAGIVAFSVLSIAWNITRLYGSFSGALRYSYFQVASVISTTGFSTADFNQWPQYSRILLVVLMFIGACAGSTGGGLKVSRVIILLKSIPAEVQLLVRPHSVNKIWLEGKSLSRDTVKSVQIYFFLYMLIIAVSALLVSFDNLDGETSFTGVIACISNIGPGLSLVGPAGNYSVFSSVSKIVLIFDMLLGRLEIYPILYLFIPYVWRRGKHA